MAQSIVRTRAGILMAFAIAVIAVLFSFAYYADQRQANWKNVSLGNQLQASVARGLTGTWKDAHGGVWSIRSDGSGRKRTTDPPKTPIYYFEWRFEPQTRKFTICNTSDNMLAKARDRIFGKNMHDFRIGRFSADGFDLVDFDSGGTLTFVPTRDSAVENAP